MGHISGIRKKTFMIATIAAIFSMTMGFMPQSEAIPLTLDLGLICGVAVPAALVALTGGPTFIGSFLLENTGNGVQPILANIGLGWFGQESVPVLHLISGTTTLSVPTTGAGGPGGPVTMTDAGGIGTDELVANLVGQAGAQTASISVDGSSPISPPFSGLQTTTMVVTADSGQCFTFFA